MSAINAINLSRFFLKFIPQDPNPHFFADPDSDPWTQKYADPCGSGSATLVISEASLDLSIYKVYRKYPVLHLFPVVFN